MVAAMVVDGSVCSQAKSALGVGCLLVAVQYSSSEVVVDDSG